MKKKLFLFFAALAALLTVLMGLENMEHIVIILSAMVTAVVSFLSAGMFAKELGTAMKLIAFGMVIVVISWFAHYISDVGLFEVRHADIFETIHHLTMAVAFVIITIGFYKIYKVATRVAVGGIQKDRKDR